MKDTDKLTVEVSEFAIAVDKVANPTALAFGGGTVVFTYTLTNPGEHALGDIEVTDDMCSPVAYVSGDANVDSILQTSETWIFTCTKSVTVTETNTATAHGCQVKEDKSPSSKDWKPECVSDTDQATVTVPSSSGGVGGVTDAPTLPPTSTIVSGAGSSDSMTWIAMMLGLFAAVTFILTPRLGRRR